MGMTALKSITGGTGQDLNGKTAQPTGRKSTTARFSWTAKAEQLLMQDLKENWKTAFWDTSAYERNPKRKPIRVDISKPILNNALHNEVLMLPSPKKKPGFWGYLRLKR